jgi:hypothetical protein
MLAGTFGWVERYVWQNPSCWQHVGRKTLIGCAKCLLESAGGLAYAGITLEWVERYACKNSWVVWCMLAGNLEWVERYACKNLWVVWRMLAGTLGWVECIAGNRR